MNKSLLKFVTDFGPLLIFFYFYKIITIIFKRVKRKEIVSNFGLGPIGIIDVKWDSVDFMWLLALTTALKRAAKLFLIKAKISLVKALMLATPAKKSHHHTKVGQFFLFIVAFLPISPIYNFSELQVQNLDNLVQKGHVAQTVNNNRHILEGHKRNHNLLLSGHTGLEGEDNGQEQRR